ncbi:MAG: hypothetical protein ACFFB3_12430, partial [Candidatus Hodarchaeota archaeon]
FLLEGETSSLHGIYSTSSEPPPIPPSPPPSGGFLAHADFEQFSVGTRWSSWTTNVPIWSYKYPGAFRQSDFETNRYNNYFEIVSHPGGTAPPAGGSNCLRLRCGSTGDDSRLYWRTMDLYEDTPNNLFRNIYYSWWVYLPSDWHDKMRYEWASFTGWCEKDHDFPYASSSNYFYPSQVAFDTGPQWRVLGGRPTIANECWWWKYYIDGDSVSPMKLNSGYGDGYGVIPSATMVGPYPTPIPRDRWFKVEHWIQRRTDGTGEAAFWVDGQLMFHVSGLRTATQSGWCTNALMNAALRNVASEYYVDEVYIYDYNAHEA